MVLLSENGALLPLRANGKLHYRPAAHVAVPLYAFATWKPRLVPVARSFPMSGAALRWADTTAASLAAIIWCFCSQPCKLMFRSVGFGRTLKRLYKVPWSRLGPGACLRACVKHTLGSQYKFQGCAGVGAGAGEGACYSSGNGEVDS